MRKKHYINVISYKDVNALQALRCTGYMTRQQLTQFISKSRIRAFCHERIIERCIVQKNRQTIECYRFTDKGKGWCNKKIDAMNSLSFYHSSSALHDIALADKYLSLTDAQRQTWKTENELRQELKECLEQLQKEDYSRYIEILYKLEQKQISMPDCTFFDEVEQGFEIITSNYGEAEIFAKLEYAKLTGTTVEFYRI